MFHDFSRSQAARSEQGLELWGGHECTVNRVGDSWFDQTEWSGHQDRGEDLARFAELGIRSLRYPALWERISPDDPARHDFGWTDARLAEIRRLGINPILTLCHHGSGPHYTSLLDDSFAPGLARHAAAVAARYPWVRDYTPVNEPLTTARFSALYGYWYPHLKDERAMWIALLNEIDATRLAMRAIREVNPRARLIQTDDLGFCHATPPLRAEADFQNERRWMGWDLLCGMVVPGHALWDRLAGLGLADRLRTIADDPCPPDVIGVNHYLSSERLLDHRIELHDGRAYADREIGEADGVQHVDVNAICHVGEDVVGLGKLLQQTWERYRRPIAVTECHLGGTREDQARWFVETWELAEALRRQGVNLRAVTAWSLLGAYDWNRMVTRPVGHYESGVFDLRHGEPRPTLIARVLKDLAEGRRPTAPGLEAPGWWRRQLPGGAESLGGSRRSAAPLMILGDTRLAELAATACEARGLACQRIRGLDGSVGFETDAWAVLDCRDDAERGANAAADLARFCSTFGTAGALFTRSADGLETPASETLLAIEVEDIFDAGDAHAVPVRILDALDAGRAIALDADQPWRQVYAPDLIDGALDLLIDGVRGRVVFTPAQPCSEAELGQTLALLGGYDPSLVVERGTSAQASGGGMAPGCFSPAIESMIERFVRDHRSLRETIETALEAAE